MANKALKICGVVAAIFPLETRENNGTTYYKQVISVAYEDGDKTRFANVALNGQKINQYASLITDSCNNHTPVTIYLDVTSNKASKFTQVNVWRIDEGDTTEVEKASKPADDTPIVGIAPTEDSNGESPISAIMPDDDDL